MFKRENFTFANAKKWYLGTAGIVVAVVGAWTGAPAWAVTVAGALGSVAVWLSKDARNETTAQ